MSANNIIMIILANAVGMGPIPICRAVSPISKDDARAKAEELGVPKFYYIVSTKTAMYPQKETHDN